MFGHHGWRPLTVALLVSGAVFLPQGVAVAALPDKPAQETAARPFVGPQLRVRDDQGGDSRGSGPSSVAGFRFSGSATTGFDDSTPTSAST